MGGGGGGVGWGGGVGRGTREAPSTLSCVYSPLPPLATVSWVEGSEFFCHLLEEGMIDGSSIFLSGSV